MDAGKRQVVLGTTWLDCCPHHHQRLPLLSPCSVALSGGASSTDPPAQLPPLPIQFLRSLYCRFSLGYTVQNEQHHSFAVQSVPIVGLTADFKVDG